MGMIGLQTGQLWGLRVPQASILSKGVDWWIAAQQLDESGSFLADRQPLAVL